MKPKNYLLLLLTIALSVSLIFIGNLAWTVVLNNSLPAIINKNIIYQSVTLLLTVLFLIVLRFSRKEVFTTYFRKGEISAPILPERWIGIKPKETENWKLYGRNFAVIITAVTTVVVFFQVINLENVDWGNLPKYLHFILLFSLTNSFVEEMITRFGVVVSLKNALSDKAIPFISAVIFGILHYWGTPGGFAGVIFAGFLGWFLSKSIIETGGIYLAWLIHFLQDVIIFSAMILIL
jgi:membrane protease YdiL (CAAX protease family)